MGSVPLCEAGFRSGSALEQGHLVAGVDLGFAGAGLGELGLAGFAEFAFLEVGEDFLGAGGTLTRIGGPAAITNLLPFHFKVKLAGATFFQVAVKTKRFFGIIINFESEYKFPFTLEM